MPVKKQRPKKKKPISMKRKKVSSAALVSKQRQKKEQKVVNLLLEIRSQMFIERALVVKEQCYKSFDAVLDINELAEFLSDIESDFGHLPFTAQFPLIAQRLLVFEESLKSKLEATTSNSTVPYSSSQN